MRKLLLGFALVLAILMAAYLYFRHPSRALGVAYAANHQVILWSTSAAIRQPVITVKYGDRLEILARVPEQAEVRTAAGETGWTSETNLLSAEAWQKAESLADLTAGLPVEVRGHTRVLSNLHVDPSRNAPRVRQLGRGVPVELFERQTAEVPALASAPASAASAAPNAEPPAPQREDWWLVRAELPDQGTLSGWVLGRFIELEVPAPLPDYASAAGMRIVAWFELNRVPDGPNAPKPQYLVVGTHGPEGQPCDFTALRVFTWSAKKQRYETAYVDSEVCGKLPVKITSSGVAGSEVAFEFSDSSHGAAEPRLYRMHATIVRREKTAGEKSLPRKHA